MFNRRALPDVVQDINMTDVNGAPSAVDEDGEFDPQEGEGDANEAPEGDSEEDDQSPLVNGLAVKVEHLKGMEQAQTIIVAMLHTGTGIESKRIVLPGEVTAHRLAQLLWDVASW